MADQKLTTADILAKCREQDGGGGAPAPEAPAAAEPEAAAPASTPEPQAPSEPAAAPPMTDRPTSTRDILAAARAQAAGGAAPSAEKTSAAEKPPAKESKPAAAPAAAAPSGPRPTSTKDILAAARAQAAGGGAAPAAAPSKKPAEKAAAKPAPSKSPATTGGEKPSVAEMLKAVRGESLKEEPQKPTRPPLPTKPKAKAPTRRNFIVAMFATPFAMAWTLFSGAVLAAGLGMARFMMPNVIVEPPSKFKIGSPADYPPGTVSTKWKSQFAVWITHQLWDGKSEIYALSTVCTHLGCTPNWLEGEQKFKCPCHGSGFYPDGINFEGPAPRPLERYGIRLASDGQLEVDKGVKFQEELGQWTDPASYVATG